MGDFWNSPSPSLFGMQYKVGEMQVLGSRMNHQAGCQEIEIPSAFRTFIPRLVTPAEEDCSLQLLEGYQIHKLDSKVFSNTTISPLPSTSTSREGQSLVTCARERESQKLESRTVGRRTQNRDAQRRFRGRKEERHQTLLQRATELEAECLELSEKFNQKTEEVSKILKEKEALTSEIQDLRKRWHLMSMLLRLPNRSLSLSSLLGADSSSTSGSNFCSSSSPSAVKAEPLNVSLEDLFGCLQGLLLPNETSSSSSPLCSAA